MPEITRQALFDAAWARPLTQVAADFGVTSTALKKICNRHDIPTPARGYWAQVRAGRTFARPKLRPVKDKRLETVQILGTPPLPPAAEAARAAVKAAVTSTSPPPAAAHPGLAATRKAIARARPDRFGWIVARGPGIVTAAIGLAQAERALALLDSLVAMAAAQGFELATDENGMTLKLGEAAVGFALGAKADLQPHVPTAKELADQKRYDEGHWNRRAFPEHDRLPSAALTLALDGAGWSGLRRNFSDRKTRPLEEQLPDIVAAVAAHAALLKQRREEAAERERRWAEEARRKQRLAAFSAREARRMKFVDAVHEQLALRGRLAAVLAHLEAASGEGGTCLPEMEAWLRRRIDQVEAVVDPRALFCSAQEAKVAFDEAAAQAGPEADRVPYYPEEVGLWLWRFDEEAGKATAVSGLDWAEELGVFSDQRRERR